MCAPIDYRDLFQVRQVRVNVRSRGFQLEGFWMGSQLIFFVETLIRRIVSHVVDIAVEIDLFEEFKRSSVVDVQFSLAAPGEEFVGVSRKHHPLRIRNSGYRMDHGSRADIDYLDCIVSQSRHKQSVASGAKMVEPPLHTL